MSESVDEAVPDTHRAVLAAVPEPAESVQPAAPPTFDPFEFILLFPGWIRRRNSAWLLLPCVVTALLVLLTTWAENTLGGAHDVRVWQDTQAIARGSVPATDPQFPLARDAISWFLFAVICTGLVLLHRHWQYIGASLTELRAAGVLAPRPRKDQPKLLTRVLRLRRIVGDADAEALDLLDQRMGMVTDRTRSRLTRSVLVLAGVLAILLMFGERRGLFHVLAPSGMSSAEQVEWTSKAYDNWWAGGDHLLGFVVYFLLAWFAMYLILTFNVVGLISVYLAVCIYVLSEPRADWYNRDGNYGWMSITLVYRSIYWALLLLGATLTVVVPVLGIQNIVSIIGLICLYVGMLPIYTGVPWLVFRQVERAAKAERERRLLTLAETVPPTDVAQTRALVLEFERCRTAKIRPLRIFSIPFSGFLSLVLLPVVLTGVQVYFTVR